MVSAVLMAGQSPLSREYIDCVRDEYKEHFYFMGYKPLKKFRGVPSIVYVMNSLEGVGCISDIVICGDKAKLESEGSVSDFLKRSKKSYTIVDQYGSIDDKVLGEFCVFRKNVPECSISANALKGYVNTAAYDKKGYALFIASDSPTTFSDSISGFISTAVKYTPKSSIIFPIVNMQEKSWSPLLRIIAHAFHRKYLFLINDTEHRFRNSFKTLLGKRDGFRVSSMVYADPYRVDFNSINLCYGVRKMFSKDVREKIFTLLSDHKCKYLWDRYFSGKLTVKECEPFVSSVVCRGSSGITLLPIKDISSTVDFDGTVEDDKLVESYLAVKTRAR